MEPLSALRFSLLLLLLQLASASPPPEGFWITAELIRVDWKDGCLTTGGCSQPRFKIVEEIQSLKEKVSISWPVSEHFVQESARQFVTHWTSGVADEVQISCAITGKDPVYGFPRVCDDTKPARPFRDADDVFNRYRRHEVVVETIDDDERRKIVELKGACFNATLMVQRHTERCPWCPDPAALSIIANELPEENGAVSAASAWLGMKNSELVHLGIFALATLCLVVTLLLCCMTFLYCRARKGDRRSSSRTLSVKPRHHPASNLSHHTYVYQKPPPGVDFDDRRYDAPWEQAARPLTYGLFSNPSSCGKSDTATTTSPLDSGSSIGLGGGGTSYRGPLEGGTSYRGLIVPPPSTRIYHQIGSPNSSMHHDDSGLESV